MRAPGRTSCASPGNVVEIRVAVPATSRGVIVTCDPVLSATGSCPLSRPVRILGPCKSCRMQMVRFSCFGGAAQAGDIARVLLMSAVGEIQPGYVHAQPHQFAQHGLGVARWADGADDFGAAGGRDGEVRGKFSRNKIQLAWFQIPECRRERPARASPIPMMQILLIVIQLNEGERS